MTKLVSKCIAAAIGEVITIAFFLWIGWWTVLLFTVMPLIWAAGKWANAQK